MRLSRLPAPESFSLWSQSCPVRSACRLKIIISAKILSHGPAGIVPVEHDPLRNCNDALLSFIQGRQFGFHCIIGVCHLFWTSSLTWRRRYRYLQSRYRKSNWSKKTTVFTCELLDPAASPFLDCLIDYSKTTRTYLYSLLFGLQEMAIYAG